LGRTLGNMDGELDQGGPVEGRRLHQLREGGDEPTISTTLSGIPKRTRLHRRSKFKGGVANPSRRRRLRSQKFGWVETWQPSAREGNEARESCPAAAQQQQQTHSAGCRRSSHTRFKRVKAAQLSHQLGTIPHIMRNTPQRTHRRGREEQMHAFARVEAMSAHADGCEARIPA